MLCATTRPGTRCLTSRSITRLWPRPIRRSHKCAAAQDQTKTDSPPEVPTPANPTAEQTATSSSPAYTFGKEQQAAAYGFLSVTSLAFGAVAFLVPELLLSTAVGGGPATALDVAFTRIAGATMAISAAAEYSVRVSNTHCTAGAFVAWGLGAGGVQPDICIPLVVGKCALQIHKHTALETGPCGCKLFNCPEAQSHV